MPPRLLNWFFQNSWIASNRYLFWNLMSWKLPQLYQYKKWWCHFFFMFFPLFLFSGKSPLTPPSLLWTLIAAIISEISGLDNPIKTTCVDIQSGLSLEQNNWLWYRCDIQLSKLNSCTNHPLRIWVHRLSAIYGGRKEKYERKSYRGKMICYLGKKSVFRRDNDLPDSISR